MTEQSLSDPFSDASVGRRPADDASTEAVSQPGTNESDSAVPVTDADAAYGADGPAADVAVDVAGTGEGELVAGDGSDPATDQTDETGETDETAETAETAEAAETADSQPAADPLEEFRESLRSKPGDWYVVHTYSGMEKRVKTNLENRIGSLNMEDFIHEVHVPQEEVWEIKNGQRRKVSRTVLPGYVLVRMDLTDESWAAVRHTPSVTGFVGHSHQPVPLSLAEVEAMLAPTIVQQSTEAAPAQQKQKKVEFTDFTSGDSVMVVDGPFASLHASITEINVDAQRVKALVEIFGRETPVELSFNQIQKA